MSTTTTRFYAGGVSKKTSEWEKITNNVWVIQMVKGVRIELLCLPPQSVEPTSDTGNEANLTGKISEMLEQGVIEKASKSSRRFVSHLFLRPKKDGTFRPILNLSKLNEYVVYRHFKMEQLATVMQLITEGAWLASIDISQAYHSLEVTEADRNLLQFIYRDQRYRFKVLPNGLSSGPRVFTKVMKAVMSYLRTVHNILLCFYIDDTIIIGNTQREVERAVGLTLTTLDRLGFTVNLVKSVLQPTRELQFLGFRINTILLKVDLPRLKCGEITNFAREVLTEPRLKIKTLAGLIGKLVATDPGNKWAKIKTKTMVRALNWNLRDSQGNYDRECTLTKRVRDSIAYWIDNLESAMREYKPKPVDVYVYTDASSHGWGYYSQTHQTHYGEQWDDTVSDTTHINVLELRAVRRMLEHMGETITRKHVRVYADNTTAVACVSKGGSARSKPCQQETGVENIEADWASRVFTDAGEWALDKDTLEGIFYKLGKPRIDMFASSDNHKLPQYISRDYDRSARGTDALTMNWKGVNGYFFPPFSCLSRVLIKILEERPDGILVTPEWPTQPWYPLLRRLTGYKTARTIPVEDGTLTLANNTTKRFPLENNMWLRFTQL